MKTKQELAEKMTSDILKSLGQENNPIGALIIMYIETHLESFEKSLKQEEK